MDTPLRKRLGAWIAPAVVAGTTLLLAAPADAFVYWGAQGFGGGPDSAVGRANTDGSNPAPKFLAATGPCGVAVNSTHIYWASRSVQAIFRANLDGTGTQMIYGGAAQPCGIAVDSTHVYWANFNGGTGTTIGRAALDGSSPVDNYISGADDPCGVAVDATHVYWANSTLGTIGRAAKANPAAPDQNFITGASEPCGVAVNAAHVYWANAFITSGIGRATIAGGDVNQQFFPADNPCGVAVDSTHAYWANRGATNAIGRVGLDGSGLTQSLTPVAQNTCGVAADVGRRTLEIGLGKLKRNRKRGLAFLSVTIPSPGSVTLARGGGLRAASEQAAAAGTVEVLLKPLPGPKRKLRKRGKLAVTANLTFTPLSGETLTKSAGVKLLQKRRRP